MQRLSKSDLELFRNGDEAIFEKIVETFYAPMRNFSLRFVNEPNSDKIMVRAFANLFHKRKTIDSTDTIRLNLYKSVYETLKAEKSVVPELANESSQLEKLFLQELIRFECLRMKSTHLRILLTARE